MSEEGREREVKRDRDRDRDRDRASARSHVHVHMYTRTHAHTKAHRIHEVEQIRGEGCGVIVTASSGTSGRSRFGNVSKGLRVVGRELFLVPLQVMNKPYPRATQKACRGRERRKGRRKGRGRVCVCLRACVWCSLHECTVVLGPMRGQRTPMLPSSHLPRPGFLDTLNS